MTAKEEIIQILISEQETYKEGSDGEYSAIKAVPFDNYGDVATKILDFAAIRAVELLKWAQKNATYSRRLTEYGYRLKSTPFSVYELLSEEELYAKFSADAGGKEGE